MSDYIDITSAALIICIEFWMLIPWQYIFVFIMGKRDSLEMVWNYVQGKYSNSSLV